MTNNDVLRRIRYIFDLDDSTMIRLFGLAEHEVTRAQVSAWLKKGEGPDSDECSDTILAIFLNGFIIEKRGRREGPVPEPETVLSNNIILTKLRIALGLKAEDVLAVMELADFKISKHELSAFFRKPGNKHYRACKDQSFRRFLNGLQKQHRPEA